MNGMSIKNTILALFAGAGSVLTGWIGGWDVFMKALVMFMLLDYITGILVASLFNNSGKTKNGGLSSVECYRGIVKKMCIIALVGVSVVVDNLSGTDFVRSATVFFFLGNEGLSIIENVGLMGMEYPDFIKKALEIFKEQSDKKGEM